MQNNTLILYSSGYLCKGRLLQSNFYDLWGLRQGKVLYARIGLGDRSQYIGMPDSGIGLKCRLSNVASKLGLKTISKADKVSDIDADGVAKVFGKYKCQRLLLGFILFSAYRMFFRRPSQHGGLQGRAQGKMSYCTISNWLAKRKMTLQQFAVRS